MGSGRTGDIRRSTSRPSCDNNTPRDRERRDVNINILSADQHQQWRVYARQSEFTPAADFECAECGATAQLCYTETTWSSTSIHASCTSVQMGQGRP